MKHVQKLHKIDTCLKNVVVFMYKNHSKMTNMYFELYILVWHIINCIYYDISICSVWISISSCIWSYHSQTSISQYLNTQGNNDLLIHGVEYHNPYHVSNKSQPKQTYVFFGTSNYWTCIQVIALAYFIIQYHLVYLSSLYDTKANLIKTMIIPC